MAIREARSRLPGDFIDMIYSVFPLHLAERVLAGYTKRRSVTLRANTLKSDVRSVILELRDAGIKVDRVPWYDSALVVKEKREKEIERLRLYAEGRVYLQSLSSMIPPLALEPRPGERVLDIAAAPGSKTTQIGALMGNQGSIVANDVNAIRVDRLRFNLERQGITIAEVRTGDASTLGAEFHEEFDRVLADVPCSGEGLFVVGDASTTRRWSSQTVRRLASTQRRLLRSAVEALKPGGILVYSTCTLGPEENELVVDGLLTEYDGRLITEPIPVLIPGAMRAFTELAGEKLSPELANGMRILPSELYEGFFVVRMRKRA